MLAYPPRSSFLGTAIVAFYEYLTEIGDLNRTVALFLFGTPLNLDYYIFIYFITILLSLSISLDLVLLSKR